MSQRNATYVSLLIVVVIALLFLFNSMTLKTLQSDQLIGPGTFPKVICILLLVFSVISFLHTRKQNNEEKLELVNFRYVIYTVGMMVIFVFLWSFIGSFYLISFLFMTFLLFLFNPNPSKTKRLYMSIGISVITVLFAYGVFGKLLNVIF